jgi:hypothetical protein
VQQGVRKIAEDLCTRQLGYRTMLDAAEADRREISEKRFTSLDRTILRDARSTPVGNAFFTVVKNPTRTDLGDMARLKEQHIAARLAVLERMGLAEPGGQTHGRSGAISRRYCGPCSRPATGKRPWRSMGFSCPTNVCRSRFMTGANERAP